MPKPSTLFSAVALAAVVAHDIKTQIRARNNAQLYLKAHEAFEETQRANEAQIKYLCHMLDEAEVPVNEFDLIVLKYHSE